MPIGSMIPNTIIPTVVNADFVQKQLTPETPKIKKMDNSAKASKEESNESEKSKEKQKSKASLKQSKASILTGVDISI